MIYAKVDSDRGLLELVTLHDEPASVRKHSNGLPALVPFVQLPVPACPAGHKIVGPIDELVGDGALAKMVRRWEAVAISPEEFAREASQAASQDPILSEVARELLDRIRILEGKPRLTEDQFRAWMSERIVTALSAEANQTSGVDATGLMSRWGDAEA